MAEAGQQWVTVAEIAGARGNKGEVAAVGYNSDPERYQQLRTVTLFSPTLPGQPFEVESVWPHGDRIVFKFAGVDSIDAAQALRGAEIRVPLSERPVLPEGEYYQSDLTGCDVVDRSSGKVIGIVQGWQEYGGPVLLEVRGQDGKEHLIPFVRAICAEIDLAGRRVGVDLPEGLLELEG